MLRNVKGAARDRNRLKRNTLGCVLNTNGSTTSDAGRVRRVSKVYTRTLNLLAPSEYRGTARRSRGCRMERAAYSRG